jgi:hypothetical protein
LEEKVDENEWLHEIVQPHESTGPEGRREKLKRRVEELEADNRWKIMPSCLLDVMFVKLSLFPCN